MTHLRTTAIALTLAASGAATGALADQHDTSAMSTGMTGTASVMQGDLIRTRDITGGDVYTVDAANDEGWNPTNMYSEMGDNWNDIGDIEDIVLSKDGQMIGIIAEIGGFLDIADKHVMIPVNDVNLVAVDDETYAFVTRFNEEELEAMESVDEGFWN